MYKFLITFVNIVLTLIVILLLVEVIIDSSSFVILVVISVCAIYFIYKIFKNGD